MPAHGYSVRRPFAIVLTVVVLHALALWALQRSVLSMAPGVPPPLERVIARLVAPPPQAQRSSTSPVAATAAKNANPSAGGATRAAAAKASARPAVASTPPTPAARAGSTAEVLLPRDAPTGLTQPVSQVPVVAGTSVASSATATTAAPAGVPGAPPVVRSGAAFAGSETGNTAGSAAAKLERPSSNADYLRNPQPDYPRLSRQRGEQGRVVVNVLIGVDGSAQKAELITSSGFERLDRAALDTVRGWRYVPGRRGGVPEAMWFAVPIQFVLQ